MKTIDSELKDCPFCGGKVFLKPQKTLIGKVQKKHIYCAKCRVSMFMKHNESETVDELIKRFCKRVTDSPEGVPFGRIVNE